ncbi:MAG: thioredoxin family protein [Actinomycetales bacterium]
MDYAGRLKVVKVNVDTSPAVARRFEATSIPLLVFMRSGEAVDTIGAAAEATLRQRVETLL